MWATGVQAGQLGGWGAGRLAQGYAPECGPGPACVAASDQTGAAARCCLGLSRSLRAWMQLWAGATASIALEGVGSGLARGSLGASAHVISLLL